LPSELDGLEGLQISTITRVAEVLEFRGNAALGLSANGRVQMHEFLDRSFALMAHDQIRRLGR